MAIVSSDLKSSKLEAQNSLNTRLFLHVSRNVQLVQKKVLKGCCSNVIWLYLSKKKIWAITYYLGIVIRMWPYCIAHLVNAVKYSPGY